MDLAYFLGYLSKLYTKISLLLISNINLIVYYVIMKVIKICWLATTLVLWIGFPIGFILYIINKNKYLDNTYLINS